MYKSKTFSDLLKVCSILPALVVMPAMAKAPAINKEGVFNYNPADGSLYVTPNPGGFETSLNVDDFSESGLTIKGDETATTYALAVARATLNIGNDAQTPIPSISILSDKYIAVGVQSNATLNMGSVATNSIYINGGTQGLSVKSSEANLAAKKITIEAETNGIRGQDGSAISLFAGYGDDDGIKINAQTGIAADSTGGDVRISLAGKRIDINASENGLLLKDKAEVSLAGGEIYINAGDKDKETDVEAIAINAIKGAKVFLGSKDAEADRIEITSLSDAAINLGFYNKKYFSEDNKDTPAPSMGAADLYAKEITITGMTAGVSAMYKSSATLEGNIITISTTAEKPKKESEGIIALQSLGISQEEGSESTITINGKERIDISSEHGIGVYSGLGSTINLTSDAGEILISGGVSAIEAFSNSTLNINGDVKIEGLNGASAISTRSTSKDKLTNVNINTTGEHSTEIIGNIEFNFYEGATPVDANVNITLAGENSSWVGNTLFAKSKNDMSEGLDKVEHMNLKLTDGATWTATTIRDDEYHEYRAINNLTVEGGSIDVQDTAHGLVVDRATISDATIGGVGDLIINDALTVKGGNNTVSNDIYGAAMSVEKGAVLNIGDASVDMDSVALNGHVIANLTDARDGAVFNVGEFTGDGKLSLVAKEEGEYKVFADSIFDGDSDLEIDSVMYKLDWNEGGTTVSTVFKSIEEVAADNSLSKDASRTVLNLAQSSSDILNNDLNLRVQRSLINGDAAAVEHMHRAIHPEKASVVHAVTNHVHGNVTKLAMERMSLPTIGRAAGDAKVPGGAWAQGMYNKSKHNGDFDGYTRGVAAGIDGMPNRNITIGAGYAVNHSNIGLTSRGMNIDNTSFFVYGQYKPNAWYANAILNYVMSDYKEQGDALGMIIRSDYLLNTFGGQLMTGYDFATGFTPEVGLRYIYIVGDKYTNTLGISNNIKDADYLTSILGAKYASKFVLNKYLALSPAVRAAVKYDLMSDDSVVAVSMPGIASYAVSGERLDRTSGEFGIGLTLSYKEVDVSLSYDIEVRKDYTSQTGMLKARYNF